ncbi:uncharacterized protein TNCV_2737161 [Trichonephila clavipes]|nr:uncharacterized protein TNCV_2737161 [Trichonephila clavipes]
MLAKNAFKKTEKPLYQQLTQFGQGRVIGLREGGFSFRDILQKDLARMYPLCMILGSSGQVLTLPQEDRIRGGHVELLRGKTPVFDVRLWRITLLLRQKFELQLVPQ